MFVNQFSFFLIPFLLFVLNHLPRWLYLNLISAKRLSESQYRRRLPTYKSLIFLQAKYWNHVDLNLDKRVNYFIEETSIVVYIIPIPQLEKCESATTRDDKFIQQNNYHKYICK